MFCPLCIHSICIPTKFKWFLCLESIKNKFIPLGDNLFTAKLKYLQTCGGCCKKKGQKVEKFDMIKIPPPLFFFSFKEGILIRNYMRIPIKIVPMHYNNNFWHKLLVFVICERQHSFCCKKSECYFFKSS